MRDRPRRREKFPGRSHRSSAVASGQHRAVYEQKKVRACRCLRRYRGCSCRGPEQQFLLYPFSRAHSAFRSQQRAFSGCGGRDTGSASRADAAPWVCSAVRRPGSSHRSVIVLRDRKPRPPGQSGPVAREIASRFRDEQGPASSGEGSPEGGTAGSGATAGSGPRRRRRPAGPAFRYRRTCSARTLTRTPACITTQETSPGAGLAGPSGGGSVKQVQSCRVDPGRGLVAPDPGDVSPSGVLGRRPGGTER